MTAVLPDYLRLTVVEERELKQLRIAAHIRHEKARKAAARQGRKDFPLFPYEDSWAFEQECLRKWRRYEWPTPGRTGKPVVHHLL